MDQRPTTIEDLRSEISSRLSAAEASRRESLNGKGTDLAVEELVLAAESLRLRELLGEDAPQVRALEARRQGVRQRAAEAARDLSLATLGESVEEGKVIVALGRLTDAEGRAVAGVDVYVSNGVDDPLGVATTDERGVYLIHVPASHVESYLREAERFVLTVQGAGLDEERVLDRSLGEGGARLVQADLQLSRPFRSTRPDRQVPLREVPGIGDVREERLVAAGVPHAAALAALSPPRLAEILETSEAVAATILEEARGAVRGRGSTV